MANGFFVRAVAKLSRALASTACVLFAIGGSTAWAAEPPVRLSAKLMVAGKASDSCSWPDSATKADTPRLKMVVPFDTEQANGLSDHLVTTFVKDVTELTVDNGGKASTEIAVTSGEVRSGLTLSLSGVESEDGSVMVTFNYELIDLLSIERKCLDDECNLFVELPNRSVNSANMTILVPPKAKGRASVVELPGGVTLKVVVI